MGAVVDVVVSIIALFVVAWVVIFGGLGAVLSRTRGGSAGAGLICGAVLGPIGWGIVLWRTRASTREISGEAWADGMSGLDGDWTAQLLPPEHPSGTSGIDWSRHDF
jgi:hypothetical protein